MLHYFSKNIIGINYFISFIVQENLSAQSKKLT